MSDVHYITEPRFRNGPGVAISAIIRPVEPDREIESVVVFGRAGGQSRMTAGEVDADLADRDGNLFAVTSRPQGLLPEGGGMGVSVNALFRFRSEGGVPAELTVHYGGETYAFRVREAA